MVKMKINHIECTEMHVSNGWAMCQKLPINGFKWERNTSKLNEDFI